MANSTYRPEPWWIPAGFAVGIVVGALYPCLLLLALIARVGSPDEFSDTGQGFVAFGLIGAVLGGLLGLVLGVLLTFLAPRGMPLSTARLVAGLVCLAGVPVLLAVGMVALSWLPWEALSELGLSVWLLLPGAFAGCAAAWIAGQLPGRAARPEEPSGPPVGPPVSKDALPL